MADLFINIINKAKGNSKMMWNFFYQLAKRDCRPDNGNNLELDIYGTLIHEPNEISAALFH